MPVRGRSKSLDKLSKEFGSNEKVTWTTAITVCSRDMMRSLETLIIHCSEAAAVPRTARVQLCTNHVKFL